MTLHVWLAFIAASIIMLLIPGPTVLLVVGDAMANGSRRAWATVAGGVSLAGAGALLRASATAFTIMKTLGGLYLIYLGAKSILKARNEAVTAGNEIIARSERRLTARFGKAYAITVLNPKSILFFVAFVPQFMSPQGSFLLQSGVLLATFTCLSILNSSTYSVVAGLVGGRLLTASAQRKVSYTGGCALIGAGALALATKQS
jgi:threonine/homoserine/homoserine lactone efflux protein